MSVTVAEMRNRQKLENLRDELRFRAVRDSFELFCETAVLIERKDTPTGYGLLELLPHQKDFAHKLMTERKIISVKGRQIGLSTETLAFLLWRALAYPGFKSLYLSHKDSYATAALDRLRLMFHQLPAWLKDRLPKPNDAAGNFTLDYGNGVRSTIVAMPVTRKVGASMTLDAVVFDEAALADYASDAYASLAPTLDAALRHPVWKGAVIIVISTARGSSNWFAQTYRKATGFTKVFYAWWVSPYYDQEQYDRDLEDARARGEEHLHFQERPANAEEAFRKSGLGRFPHAPKPEDCRKFPLRGRLAVDDDKTQFVPDASGPLHIAELPIEGREYVMSVDPASGKGLDYTVATIGAFDEDGLPYIAAYWRANDVEPLDQAREMERLGYFYAKKKGALIAVENSGGHGATIITYLRSEKYKSIYRYKQLTSVHRKARTEYGIATSKTTKPAMVNHFASVLNDLGNVSEDLALELASFVVKDNGSMSADTGAHDDLVMSAVIFAWVLFEPALTGRKRGDGVAAAAAIGEDAPAVTPEGMAVVESLQRLFTDAQRVRSAKSRSDRRATAAFTRAARRGRR